MARVRARSVPPEAFQISLLIPSTKSATLGATSCAPLRHSVPYGVPPRKSPAQSGAWAFQRGAARDTGEIRPNGHLPA